MNGDLVSPANNIPFIYRLDFQAAARYVDHSAAGGDVTYTVGSRWAPVRDLSFRGNFTHAIRSPSIQEAFIPTSTFFGFATDPCDRQSTEQRNQPGKSAGELRGGGHSGDLHSREPTSASFLQSTAGNPNLKNEKSNAWSVGGVLTPRFIPGLNVSVDYISVKLKDAISAFSATQRAGCLLRCGEHGRQSVLQPVHAQRGASAEVRQDQLLQRVGAAVSRHHHVVGLEGEDTVPGRAEHARLERFVPASEDADDRRNSGSSPDPYRWIARLSDQFVVDDAELPQRSGLAVRERQLHGPVNQFNDVAANFYEHNRISSFTYVNGGGAYDFGKFRVFADVDNIFNVKPPFPVPAGGGAITYFPGVLGRVLSHRRGRPLQIERQCRTNPEGWESVSSRPSLFRRDYSSSEALGADPARGDMLDAAGDRQPGMDCALVGRAIARGIAEQQAVARAAANLEAERRERRFAAVIIVVEIDEEGEHALLARRDIG